MTTVERLFPPVVPQRPPYDGAEVATWLMLATAGSEFQVLGVFKEEESIVVDITHRE